MPDLSRMRPTPVEKLALHARPLAPGGWYACAHPERPRDDRLTKYDWRCRPCFLAAQASLVNQGDMERKLRVGEKRGQGPYLLSAIIARVLEVQGA